jgi:hypothetical protein
MGREEVPSFSIDQEGVLWYNGHICVPSIDELKQLILKEAHDTPYSVHLEGTKMYQDLKEQFWWHGMKREIAFYIAGVMSPSDSRLSTKDLRVCYSL